MIYPPQIFRNFSFNVLFLAFPQRWSSSRAQYSRRCRDRRLITLPPLALRRDLLRSSRLGIGTWSREAWSFNMKPLKSTILSGLLVNLISFTLPIWLRRVPGTRRATKCRQLDRKLGKRKRIPLWKEFWCAEFDLVGIGWKEKVNGRSSNIVCTILCAEVDGEGRWRWMVVGDVKVKERNFGGCSMMFSGMD